MSNALVDVLRKHTPGFIKSLYRRLKYRPKKVFSDIKEKNFWGCDESVSGKGSTLEQTKTLIPELSKLLKEKNIKTLLDIPCGDFNWMRHVDLADVNYIGADIVDGIIKENTEKYETDNIKFATIDLIGGTLPQSDIIFVRDCFVHLSNEYIFKAIKNIKKSGSKYLLTTTFTNVKQNDDIVTGSWRPLNLQAEPFMFPKPEYIIVENCTEENGKYRDKSMGLWEIALL